MLESVVAVHIINLRVRHTDAILMTRGLRSFRCLLSVSAAILIGDALNCYLLLTFRIFVWYHKLQH